MYVYAYYVVHTYIHTCTVHNTSLNNSLMKYCVCMNVCTGCTVRVVLPVAVLYMWNYLYTLVGNGRLRLQV